MKTKQLAFTALVAILAFCLTFFASKPKNDFPSDRLSLTLRWIGDQLLRQAGDTSSRVLPVREIAEGHFQLEFQSEFKFVPDTLVQVVHNALQAERLPLRYSVNVLDCSTDQVVYGYRIGSERTTLVPCLGREQPAGCYVIQIAFERISSDKTTAAILSGATALTIFAVVAWVSFRRNRQQDETPAEPGYVPMGNSLFSEGRRTIRQGQQTIALTDKEARLLSVLVAHPNEAMDRDRLLKEVWEDDGVIVGRSLDVFISKLRKKLVADPSIRVVSIHGKGYKLEIG